MADVQNNNPQSATPEQVLYAKVLQKGMYLGLLLLFVTFAIYILGILDPYIPMKELPGYWSLGVNEYLHEAKINPGWAWAGMLGYSDFMNFIGIVILSGVTIVCYISIVPTLLRNNDKVYAVIAVLEVLVLSLAASGILAAGH